MNIQKYGLVSFCSIVGNFAYAYPTDNNNDLTLEQINNSPYTVNIYKNEVEAITAMEKLQQVIYNAK